MFFSRVANGFAFEVLFVWRAGERTGLQDDFFRHSKTDDTRHMAEGARWRWRSMGNVVWCPVHFRASSVFKSSKCTWYDISIDNTCSKSWASSGKPKLVSYYMLLQFRQTHRESLGALLPRRNVLGRIFAYWTGGGEFLLFKILGAGEICHMHSLFVICN